MRKEKMLTTREVAERIGVKYSTVMLWLRENKLAGAVKEMSPRGAYWLIPESSIAGIVKRKQGRPKKAEPPVDQADTTPAKPKRRMSNRTAAKKALMKTRKKGTGN
jgi:excisionase family DNA binding protein